MTVSRECGADGRQLANRLSAPSSDGSSNRDGLAHRKTSTEGQDKKTMTVSRTFAPQLAISNGSQSRRNGTTIRTAGLRVAFRNGIATATSRAPTERRVQIKITALAIRRTTGRGESDRRSRTDLSASHRARRIAAMNLVGGPRLSSIVARHASRLITCSSLTTLSRSPIPSITNFPAARVTSAASARTVT